MNLTVARSPWRMTLLLLLAVPAVLLGIDMLGPHRWVPLPDSYDAVVGTTIDDGGNTVNITVPTLTLEGKAQRRRDLAFGWPLVIGGAALMGYSFVGLLRPRAVLRATDEGISVRVDGPAWRPRLLPWESIVEVRSGVLDEDGATVPVLSIHLGDPAMVPVNPAGGVADSPWLHLWSEEWDQPAHQLAPLLDPRARHPARSGAA